MKSFKIKKNRHFSNGAVFRILNYDWNINYIVLDVMFENNCWYSKNQVSFTGINKLYGISYGLFGVHKSSLRIGWQPDFDIPFKIRLFKYTYNYQSNNHNAEQIYSISTDEKFQIIFKDLQEDENQKIYVYHNRKQIIVSCDLQTKKLIHYHYPYFGGKSVAPHSMNIFIEKSKKS